MKKALKKQAAFVVLSAAVAVQTGFPGYAATTVTGNWANEDGGWKFYNSDHQAYTGWVKTESGWYYLNPADRKMATGWQKIDGFWYYFETAQEGIEGRMHTGWYKTAENTWYFFENGSGSAAEGHMVTGWQWIDGYCYYFSAEPSDQPGVQGAMYAGRRTPDDYPTNADGQWTQEDQAVYRPGLGFSTKTSSSSGSSSGSSSSGGSHSGGGSSSGGSSNSGSNSGSNNGNNGSNEDPSTPDKPDTPDTPEQEEYQYLLMNIPYEEFYEAEIEGNEMPVDGVSSATKTKTRTGSLVGGSYHVNSDGTDISGVIFPVKVAKDADLSKFKQITDSDSLTITVTNRGKEVTTTYEGKEALFESADYSYYILSQTPDYYKELTIDENGTLSFGEVQGEKENIASGVSATLSTETNYGDYQLSFTGLPSAINNDTTVYGVVLHTDKGEDYGLRHLENIWLRTNLAWSAGIVTTTHGNTLKSAHYESMMGKAITGVTYYTSNGVLEITLDDEVYVPFKFAHAEFDVAGATVESGKAEISGLDAVPDDYEAEYTITDPNGNTADGFTVENGQVVWSGKAIAGTYTLTAKDKKDKYAELTASFVLTTESIPATATANADGVWSLTVAEDATADELKSYLSSIVSVTVNGTKYQASGRRAVIIIDPNTGIINTDAKSGDEAIFVTGEKYEIEVEATGYKKNLTFEMIAGEAPAPEGTVVEGSAMVDVFNYEAKVKVTYNAENGVIEKVEDNGTEPGSNKSFWQTALDKVLSRFIGKTKDTVDEVDAKSGATYSANAIKKAVKNALPDNGVEKPDAPKLTTADFRTKFLYAGTDSAELAVEAEDDAVVRYTIDGSDPSANGNSVLTAVDGVITITPETNADQTITVKAVAIKNGVASAVTEQEVQFIEIPETQSGMRVYEGSSIVNTPSGKPYTAKLKVTVANGKIVKIEDNGTETTDIRDEAFWGPYMFPKYEQGISAKFAGKDLEELVNAKTVPNSTSDLRVDAVTGATVSSDAVKYAVIDAMRSEPIDSSDETVMAPTVTAGWKTLVTRKSYGVNLRISAGENTTVYCTTDGSDPTLENGSRCYGSVTVYANNKENGDKVQVKFAGFDADGNRSKIVSVWCAFTDNVPSAIYKTGTYTGSADDLEATVTVTNGYGDRPIISLVSLDEESQQECGDFLSELLAEVFYEQSTKIDLLDDYDAEKQQKVLDAIDVALEKALSAEVSVSLNPEKKIYGTRYGKYEFDEAPEVTLSCAVKGTEIYYHETDSSATETPDADTWTLYDGAFTPTFTNEQGGTLYINVASTKDGENWLDTRQISITYKEKPDENTVMIGDTGYTSLEKAFAEVEDGDTIVLNKDINLEDSVEMPKASFTITSAEGECYKLESKYALELNGDLEISNLDWDAEAYLNGHNFTAGEGLAESEWSYTTLYASSKTGSVERNPEINIQSGQFEIYGVARNAELIGDLTVSVSGASKIKFIGAQYSGKLDGDISVTVNGDEGAMLYSFVGRQSSGEVTGDLNLKLEGAVELNSGWLATYQTVQYNDDASWGTLDLSEADLTEDEVKLFKGFKNVIKANEDEITEELPATEVAEKKAEIETDQTEEITEDGETAKDETTEEDSKKDETASDEDEITGDDEIIDSDETTDEITDDAEDERSEDDSKDSGSENAESEEKSDEDSEADADEVEEDTEDAEIEGESDVEETVEESELIEEDSEN